MRQLNNIVTTLLLGCAILLLCTSYSNGFFIRFERRCAFQVASTSSESTLLRLSMDDGETASQGTTVPQEVPKPVAKPLKCPNCDLCDGSGRIMGGIGTVLSWWPVKAYRPCPNFINAGGFYERAGQGLDEIAFGRDSTFQPEE